VTLEKTLPLTSNSDNHVSLFVVNEDDIFNVAGESRVFTMENLGNRVPFSVTLAWTDPATNDGSLENDLDLEVSYAGNTYFGNRWLANGPSGSKQRDRENNVERIYLSQDDLLEASGATIGSTGSLDITITVKSHSLPGGAQSWSLAIAGDENGEFVEPEESDPCWACRTSPVSILISLVVMLTLYMLM